MALAPSRILPTTCTTRYGEAPFDDEVAAAWRTAGAPAAARLPWFALSHRDMPSGTVWMLAVCPPVRAVDGRNLPAGEEPSDGAGPLAEIVLPEATWIVRLLSEGQGARRTCRAPAGTWISEWSEGSLERLEGPHREGSALLERWMADGPAPVLSPWRHPLDSDLADLAREHPEAQMLSDRTASVRSDRLADRTLAARLGAILLVGSALAMAIRAPVWILESRLGRTRERLATVRPELERLDRMGLRAVVDAAYLDSSAGALRPSASAGPILADLARKLPPGVKLQSLQLESPPGDTGWALRVDAKLPDWRGVATLVDSTGRARGVGSVRVENQQRDAEKVHLVLSALGSWP